MALYNGLSRNGWKINSGILLAGFFGHAKHDSSGASAQKLRVSLAVDDEAKARPSVAREQCFARPRVNIRYRLLDY